MKPLCIYHGGCDDGFAAAWAVRHALGDDVEFHAGQYGREPPDVTGRDIIMVDFSYKYPVIAKMTDAARSILILDHHKTAQEELAPYTHLPMLAGVVAFRDEIDAYGDELGQSGFCPVRVLFDMERSGAGIAWDFFHTQRSGHIEARPSFIDYIEDRDLWRKSLPGVDDFTIALRSYPMDFSVWDKLVQAGPNPLITEGKVIQRYYRLRVEELKRAAYPSVIPLDAGMYGMVQAKCMACNAPYFAASEVAGELAAEPGVDFGLCYFEGSDGTYYYSLRSRADFDVSAIAKHFGGGGHKNAAGFKSKTPVHRLAGAIQDEL